MKRSRGFVDLLVVSLVVAGLVVGFGCGKKPPEPGGEGVSADAAQKLPGAADVMAAVTKKDYEGAVAALMKVKEGLTSEDQIAQFVVLARQTRDKISELGGTDQKAQEAVSVIRSLTTGGR
ncbi:MAG: hypothetical protein EXS31_00090 [Pedosphaera sp.]|nr:hypothetical protein [Pedosphaera sp.]